MLSIDAPINEESGGRLFSETIADSSSIDPGEMIDRERVAGAIRDCIKKLSAREEKILRLRFGIVEDLLEDESFNV